MADELEVVSKVTTYKINNNVTVITKERPTTSVISVTIGTDDEVLYHTPIPRYYKDDILCRFFELNSIDEFDPQCVYYEGSNYIVYDLDHNPVGLFYDEDTKLRTITVHYDESDTVPAELLDELEILGDESDLIDVIFEKCEFGSIVDIHIKPVSHFILNTMLATEVVQLHKSNPRAMAKRLSPMIPERMREILKQLEME